MLHTGTGAGYNSERGERNVRQPSNNDSRTLGEGSGWFRPGRNLEEEIYRVEGEADEAGGSLR